MGGAACAKEILCNPPARARADNRYRMTHLKADCERDLKIAKLEGFRELSARLPELGLSEKQMQCYHRVAAVLDGDDKTFDEAYSALRESLIVS